MCCARTLIFFQQICHNLLYVDQQKSHFFYFLRHVDPFVRMLHIYINDLPSVSHVFKMIMYADDTTLYCNLNDPNCEIFLNNELSKISEWLSSNKLSLIIRNLNLCFSILSRKRVNYPVLKLNNVVIKRVPQFNFLCVILNSRLKWDKHIEHISLKVSRVSGVSFRLKHVYPQEVLLTLYNTLILPHLIYYILVWGSKNYIVHRLHLLQKQSC